MVNDWVQLRPVNLERRLAELILNTDEFTADDLTDNGAISIDPLKRPNQGQNGIGSLFNQAARRQLIEFTGRITRSKAAHRKGGSIRVWRGTDAGRLWARKDAASTAPAYDEEPF